MSLKIIVKHFTILVMTVCLPTWADERPPSVPTEARWVKVDRVTDGDTIVLMDRTRVRLHGIDAPERDQPYGPIAAAALEYMVASSVYLFEVDEDRYGRLVGQLFHYKEGYDINASMVCKGNAWWYERYAADSEPLKNCQTEAKSTFRGLWVEGSNVISPWEWRRGRR